MIDRKLFKKYLGIYRQNSLVVKLHVMMRLLGCPINKIEPFVPQKGTVLDFGCGYGVLAHYFNLTSQERTIIGFDTAEDKIEHALKTLTNDHNINFYKNNINHIGSDSMDCITIVDVLYLIPFRSWHSLLKKCCDLLKVSGVFLLKEMDKKPFWKYLWNNFQETMSVKLFKVTSGSSFQSSKSFYIKSQDELREELENIGFKVEAVRIDKGYLHPHILYVCQKI